MMTLAEREHQWYNELCDDIDALDELLEGARNADGTLPMTRAGWSALQYYSPNL